MTAPRDGDTHAHAGHDHDHDHGPAHHHDHDHPHAAIEDHDTVTAFHLLEQAVRELLIETGVLSAAEIQRQIELQESRTPAMGGRIVARAWTDPAFRQSLLEDPKSTLAAMGVDIAATPELRVLENSEDVHHVVVCTLCSCYPRMLLGVPPAWYKSREYRARVVHEPRVVLKEFGVELPPDTDVRVVDSTADLRYLIIPRRPPGSEGLDEAALAGWVGRDAMIGTGLARAPGA
jgi:nitrile hydratase